MGHVLSYSILMILGIVASQLLPGYFGSDMYGVLRNSFTFPILYTCFAFIMINEGREFEIVKEKWRSYSADYFIAMAAAALPWLLVAGYFIYALLPESMWDDPESWKESLLMARFAAPTSSGVLFTMLAAMKLTKGWIYKKIQTLAIFDDLDTIILMIPLQMMMLQINWQMGVMLIIIVAMLIFGWRRLDSFDIPQNWQSILLYASVIYYVTHLLYVITKGAYGAEGAIHIEVLLPAFVVGMVIKHKAHDSKTEMRVSMVVSGLFMFLVGMSMPLIFRAGMRSLSWEEISMHVTAVTALSLVGKLVPLFFYRDRTLHERLAVAVGMFTRGEVGAGVVIIAVGYGIGGDALIISVLTLVLNMMLTGGFVLLVRHFAKESADILAAAKMKRVRE